ncbi:ABC transporter permease [Schinkia azotoformans]|uniref:Binding-protein-dependent transport system inner membrane protein n=1 Tax=Schinkia azotoformans LMG 9581 TaxID=1131731 RepID=K6D4D7_SCHAZ|nr:ABC transporter permease [Schinkia azotoformans]EKN62918.1 binding-protein-dependent transport system inner membrane protein [Schinkia azotoformans LMG 9581]MEC1639821.1 ABC transporter permease [Schinkia azotoformans]MEC1947218.1 ABC transporter permease [Schinkia azotoformans]
MRLAIKRIVFFIVLFGIWELVVRLFNIPKVLMPAPTDVVLSLQESLADGSLLHDLRVSFTRLLIGLVIALIIGVLLGVFLAKSKTADETLGAFILALQSIPSIVWLPLAIMWFGLNEKSVIFIVVLGATIVMTINMRIGIKNVSPLYIKAAQTMGSNGLDLFFRVAFPASIPYVVTGVRLAWAFAWRALMAGELLSTGPGLGYTLKFASDFGRMDIVLGIMVVIGVIGVTVDLIVFQRIEKRVMTKWGLVERNG